MRKVDLQQQAVALIRQLSTEKLKEVVNYLADLQDRDAANILSTYHAQEIPEKGLGTAIHEIFKPFGGVELEIPPREPMRETPRSEYLRPNLCPTTCSW